VAARIGPRPAHGDPHRRAGELRRGIGRALLLAAAVAPASDAAADPGAGERAFQKCYSCHSVEPGETGLTGPNLRGIVGAPIARDPDFAYSDGLRRLAVAERVWSEPLLDRFIADPWGLVPDTEMAFPGIRDPAERAALIDWLGGLGADGAVSRPQGSSGGAAGRTSASPPG
jgi:cytochrome c